MFIIERCKREGYIKAWNAMYLLDKKMWNAPMFDGVNPALNKAPLSTETDNFCVVAYDSEIPTEGFEHGMPVGIFSFVVTPRKVIGKQYVVNPNYQGKGLGKALLIENERTLLDNGYSKYYIGCSSMSARILMSWGIDAFSSDIEGDLYKFNVDINRENFEELYRNIITNNENIKVVGLGVESQPLMNDAPTIVAHAEMKSIDAMEPVSNSEMHEVIHSEEVTQVNQTLKEDDKIKGKNSDKKSKSKTTAKKKDPSSSGKKKVSQQPSQASSKKEKVSK